MKRYLLLLLLFTGLHYGSFAQDIHFTDKSTSKGNGIGLSLTYDLVVKGHGGTIQVNSIDGEGSEFIIDIPV